MNGNLFTYSWFLDEKETERTVIKVYGVNKENETICLLIEDFSPYAYVELPDIEWNQGRLSQLMDKINSFMRDKKPLTYALQYKEKYYGAHIEPESISVGPIRKKKFPFLLLTFNTRGDIRMMNNILRKYPIRLMGMSEMRLKTQETSCTEVLQLTTVRKLPTSGWITFKGGKEIKTDREGFKMYRVKWKYLYPLDSNECVTPLVLSFDIEVNSSIPTTFPDATRDLDKVFQISCVLHRTPGNYTKYLLSLGYPSRTVVEPDVTIRTFDTEDLLLNGFTAFIQEFSPNILIGYNIFTFDIPYMIDRAKGRANCFNEFDKMGFDRDVHAKEKTIVWSSSAYGKQEFQFLDVEGVLIVDLLTVIRRDHKLSNYKLNTVSKLFLKDEKKDLDAKSIFKCYRLALGKDAKGEPVARSERGDRALGICGNYCVQDTLLVSKLYDKLDIWLGLSAMATVCRVPIFHLFTQGQQVKVYSQIYNECTHTGIVVEDTNIVTNENEHYSGAKVFPPIPGVYDKVVPFDFASLYPSAIIAHNIDPSTFVTDPNVPDSLCHVIEWDDHQGCDHDPKIVKRNELSEYIVRENALITAMRKEKKPRKEEIAKRVLALKPYIKQRAELNKSKPKHIICGHNRYRFLKEPIGVLPRILKHLLDSRSATKKQMKALEEGELLYNVLDKRQLAYKVSANSAYGAMGVTKGYLPFMPGAMCTTAIGRKSVELVAKTIPSTYGGQLVYGDSVSGDTPILIKYGDDTIDLKTIDDLGDPDKWSPYDQFKPNQPDMINKEQCVVEGRIWTGKWSQIKRVIRHRTTKKMYRILTHTGCVDVTEDHSLLSLQGEQVKPTEVEVGFRLLHSFPSAFEEFDVTAIEGVVEYKACSKCKKEVNINEFYVNSDGTFYTSCKECVYKKNNEHKEYLKPYVSEYDYFNKPKPLTKEEAFVWGFFMADGKYNSGKYSWSLSNQDLKLLERCQGYLEIVEPCYRFVILDVRVSSAVYKLVPLGKVKMIAQKYGQIFYDKRKRKIVPYSILNASLEIKKWFFEGYYAGDGYLTDKESKGGLRMDCKGAIGIQGLYILLKSLGYTTICVNTREDKHDIFRLNATMNKGRKDPTAIKKIIPLPPMYDYVYDIETDEGVFHAGIGELILKNTDSAYINFPHLANGSAKEIWEYCEHVAIEVSKLFKAPMKLAFEEVIYWRFLILSKKRYMSMKCGKDGVVSDEISKKGVLLARRDNSDVVRNVYSTLVKKVFANDSFDDIIYFLIQEINAIFGHYHPNSEFVVSQSVGDVKIPDLDSVEPDAEGKIGSYKVKRLPEDPDERARKITDKGASSVSEYYLKSLPPQAQLAIKLQKRGRPVETGERLEYVITTEAKIGARKSEKIESYEYFQSHAHVLCIDYFYYLKQLVTPVDEVLNALYMDKLKGDFIASQYKFRLKREGVLNEIRELSRIPIVVEE